MSAETIRLEQVDVYWVRWLDSATVNGGRWTSLDDEGIKPQECVSAGFLVHSNDTFIALAGQLDGEGNGGDIIAIPRACVLEMKAWNPAGTP